MKCSVVLVYNSFKDPLFQATLWLYLKEESLNKRFTFHLITFEQEEYQVSLTERHRIKQELHHFNIIWHPLKWHSGRFKFIKKVYDLLFACLLVLRIKIASGVSSIISLGTVAGSFAYILAKLFRLKCYIYQFERHSEFLADFGIWRKDSISFKMLHNMETISSHGSEILATGTSHMLRRLEDEVKARVFYLPSCVDDDKFVFNSNSRRLLRERLGVVSECVVIYVGKFGGIYLTLEEVAAFFSDWFTIDPATFFVILTPQDAEEVEKSLLSTEMENDKFFIGSVPHSEIPSYLSAADVGIVAIPSLPSQKFRSPIKVGEYLCCGLPYVVGQGISDDDKVAKENNVGVVIDSYDKEGLLKVLPDLKRLVGADREKLRKCGVQYRGFSELKKTGKEIFDALYEIS